MAEQTPINALARRHLIFGLTFALLGMALGIYMSVTQNFAQRPTHVHILLVGFVVSSLYAIVYRLWLATVSVKLATTQTLLHQLGAIVMVVGLFLLSGGMVGAAAIGPVLGLAALAVFLGAALMLYQVLRDA